MIIGAVILLKVKEEQATVVDINHDISANSTNR